MKKLLKRLFFRESPAAGAVFSTLLVWLGTWCLASVFLIADGFPACFPETFRMRAYAKPSFAWQHLLLVAEGVLCFYHLVVTDRFYRELAREKWPFGRHVLDGIYLVIVASFAFFRDGVAFFIALYLLWCWATPLLFMPKQWKWLIPAALTPLCFLPMATTFTGTVLRFLLGDDFPALFLRLQLPNAWLFYLLCLFAVFCIFCRLKACAGAAGRSLLALFGKGALGICGVFLLTYTVTLGMAFAAHCRTERHVAELEKFFGRPVTAQGLKALYFQNRKADGAFWRKMKALSENYPDCVHAYDAEFSPEEFARCRKELENFGSLREMEKMLSSEPPAADLDFRRGNIAGMETPALSVLEGFVKCEVWRVRLAIADRKGEAALAALKRMNAARECLAREPFLLSQLFMVAAEMRRLDALERLLSSGLLTDGQLREVRAQLAVCRGEMKSIHAEAVYKEAVAVMDCGDLFACGGMGWKKEFRPGLYAWRWAFPAMWYVFTRNRDVLAQAYKTEDFSRLPYKEENATSHFLPRIMLSALKVAGGRINSLTDRYLAMETSIGVELEKRRTGKYPDVLKDPPRDSFGEVLLYRKGKLPVIRPRWDAKKKTTKTRKEMVDVVAVWSKGPNKKDDQGVYEQGYSGDGTPDDSRAFFFLDPRP